MGINLLKLATTCLATLLFVAVAPVNSIAQNRTGYEVDPAQFQALEWCNTGLFRGSELRTQELRDQWMQIKADMSDILDNEMFRLNELLRENQMPDIEPKE